eukprot:13522802-Alexandrium_andersonii.AAC.1
MLRRFGMNTCTQPQNVPVLFGIAETRSYHKAFFPARIDGLSFVLVSSAIEDNQDLPLLASTPMLQKLGVKVGLAAQKA